MRTLISETFLAIVLVLIVLAGLFFVRNFIAETIDDIRIALEEKRLDRRITAKLKRSSAPVLRSIVMGVMLWDPTAFLDWLQTKSILPDIRKQSQIETCRRTIEERRDHYSTQVRHMEPAELVKLIRGEIRDRDSAWRRRFLERLERHGSAFPVSEEGSEKKSETT